MLTSNLFNRGERVYVLPDPDDELFPWKVFRGTLNRRANEIVEEAVVNSLVYSPDLDRYFVRGAVVESGAQFIVRQ